MLHSLHHAFLDSIKMSPLIFVIYLLIEYIEHRNNTDLSHILMKSKKLGPIYGSFLGCVPQCGFSVIASDLYSKRAITLGTLISIFIATSDEAIPIILSHPSKLNLVIMIIIIKLIISILSGFIIDLFYKSEHSSFCDKHNEHLHFHGNCENCEGGALKSAIVHTVKIFIFVFIVTFIFETIIDAVGEDTLSLALLKNTFFQPFVAALIGLIPNCAASVVLAQGYLTGAVTFGSLIAGLSSGAGVGLIVLFRHNKNLKQNLTTVILIYLIGALSGVIIGLI